MTIADMLSVAARTTGAKAVALYEAGYSLKASLDLGPRRQGWTGLVYLVAGWGIPRGVPSPERLAGFPTTLDVEAYPRLLGSALTSQGGSATARVADVGPLREALAAEGRLWSAALAVGSRFNPETAAVMLMFFETVGQAEDVGRRFDRRDPRFVEPINQLRQALENASRQSHLDFITGLTPAVNFGSTRVARLGAVRAKPFDELLSRLASHLRCPDVRIYLTESLENLAPSQSRNPDHKAMFELYGRSSAEAQDVAIGRDDTGPLGWVLRNQRQLRLHNPVKARLKETGIRGLYDDLGRFELAGPQPAWDGGAERGPALLVDPIMLGNHLIGVISCSGRDGSPFSFHDWDETSIRVVALSIASSWAGNRAQDAGRIDEAVQGRTSRAMKAFSQAVERIAANDPISDEDVYLQAIKAANLIINQAPFCTIRIFDEAASEFRFINFDWRRWSPTLPGPFRVSPGAAKDARSAAEYVYRSREYVVVNVAAHPAWFRNSFPDHTTHAAFFPIFRFGGQGRDAASIRAILDIRSVEPEPFHVPVLHAIERLAETLALALAVLGGRREALDVNKQLDQTIKANNEAYEDLAHQVASPLRNARSYLEEVVQQLQPAPVRENRDADLRGMVRIALGQTRRAFRVGRMIDLFAELNRDGRITRRSNVPISLATLRDTLGELIEDERSWLQMNPRRKFIRSELEDLEELYRRDFIGDVALFEETIACLLDNAGKYSDANTTIIVRAGRSADDRHFFIEVENHGKPIEPGMDIRARGVRGKAAALSLASGRGLGLHLASSFACALNGEIEIIPAKDRSVPHRFRLKSGRSA